MLITCNTYGLRSINTNTFNLKWHTNYTYPQDARNVVVTVLKLHNLFLNVLGYVGDKVSMVSGSLRILSGCSIMIGTSVIGDRDATEGVIIGHWYDEALLTGAAQVVRGILEAFVPYGRIANLSLDTLGTVVNLLGELSAASVCEGCMEFANHGPHPDPEYPFPLGLLHII